MTTTPMAIVANPAAAWMPPSTRVGDRAVSEIGTAIAADSADFAREADRDRRQGRAPRPLYDVPTRRGRHPGCLFTNIVRLNDDPRPRPAPASAGDIDGEVRTTGEVWRRIRANGLPSEGRSPKSGHRMAAEGMQFSWRWNGGTIFPNLDVIRGMSTQGIIRGIPVQTGRRRSDPGGRTSTFTPLAPLWHPSGKLYTPWADTVDPLAESASLKEETP